MSIEDFIKEKETPYSKIKNVKLNENGLISYDEVYDLSHPMCPIVNIECDNGKHTQLTINNFTSRMHFEIMYGSIEEE